VNNKTFFSTSLGFALLGILSLTVSSLQIQRRPASLDEHLTLKVETLKIQPQLKISKDDTLVLRLIVNRTHEFDLTPQMRVNSGDEIALKSKVVVKPTWLNEGNLEFRLELVKIGFLNQVVIRCAQVSKKVNDFNRTFQCAIPGVEDVPVLYYSLRRGTLEGAPIARQ